ncbi:peptidase [Scytonema sp. PCC 10023]|uniref:peptidase n=1 Tax=Scytonema sp. PCC 10023 TaxID=1680591 RepID=UPI0039C5D036
MSLIEIGPLPSNGTPVTRYNSVTPADPTDIFGINLTSTSNINLALTNISAGDDADLRLFRDTNGNGELDRGVDQQVPGGISNRGSNLDDSINVADQPAGMYFAEVSRFGSSSGSVSYRLSASTADPSNLIAIEHQLGNLSPTQDLTFTGQVGNTDTSDIYAFSLGFSVDTNISLTGLSSDADIRVMRDTNGNRIFDSNDEIVRSVNGSTTPDSINLDDAGNYFLQVYQYSGDTNYTLTFDNYTTSTV